MELLSVTTDDVTTLTTQISTIGAGIEIVFVVITAFNNTIRISSCDRTCVIIRLPAMRVLCIADAQHALIL